MSDPPILRSLFEINYYIGDGIALRKMVEQASTNRDCIRLYIHALNSFGEKPIGLI